MADLSFVRKEVIPERAAPLSETGVIGWFRKNMFSDIPNTILTIIVAYFIISVLWNHIAMGFFSNMEFSFFN